MSPSPSMSAVATAYGPSASREIIAGAANVKSVCTGEVIVTW